MRLKKFKVLSAAMLFLFTISLTVTNVKSADYTATIYVDPASVLNEAMGTGSTFDLAFKIRDAVDCYSWSINVSYDPTVLTIINYAEGDFLYGPSGVSWNMRYEYELGWFLITESIIGSYPPDEGIDGDGWLVNFTFQVLTDYGRTVVNIDDPLTHIYTFPPYPPAIELVNIENGYFSNMIPGDIMGDTPGSPPDGDVDMFDLGEFADAYGSHEGQPKYNELADLMGDTPGSPPDGDVDMFDLGEFADNYGRSI
jgi:hypothetical protein